MAGMPCNLMVKGRVTYTFRSETAMKKKPELRIEDGHDLRRHVLSCSHLDPADATIMKLAALLTSIYQKRKANKKKMVIAIS